MFKQCLMTCCSVSRFFLRASLAHTAFALVVWYVLSVCSAVMPLQPHLSAEALVAYEAREDSYERSLIVGSSLIALVHSSQGLPT
jgi:hypothetical protein